MFFRWEKADSVEEIMRLEGEGRVQDDTQIANFGRREDETIIHMEEGGTHFLRLHN